MPAPSQARIPSPQPVECAPKSDPLDWPAASKINGSVIKPDACCAAAALLTLADTRTTNDKARAMKGGADPNNHHPPIPGGKEPAPNPGPHDDVNDNAE